MDGITATRKIGFFRTVREDSVRPQMNIVSPIFVLQNFAIAGEQDGDRIGQQHATRSHGAGEAIQPFVANASIFQIYRIHEVMQCDVRVGTAEASEHRRHQPRERDHGTAAECAEKQIEPYDVGFQTAHRTQQMNNTLRTVV
jgi:hypothetical protein